MKAIDLETTGLDFNRDKIICVGVGGHVYPDGSGWNLPDTACYHNGKFDLKFLRKAGNNLPPYSLDTMLAASLLINRPEKLSLDSLAKHYLGVDSWKSLDRKKMASHTFEEIAAYNRKDLVYTEQLANILSSELVKEGSADFFNKLLMPAARMLLDVEYRGMRIDVPAMQAKAGELTREIEKLSNNMNLQAGRAINWNSPKQIMALLKSKGIIPKAFMGKPVGDGKWIYDFFESTNAEALESVKHLHPSIPLLLSYKEQVKTLSFLESWLETQFEGRLYPTYNLANTRTGRLSCSEPNLQQVPRDKTIRGLFIPTEGKVFVIADYAQIEPRIAAHYSQDKELLEVFTNGLDFYGSIANRVLGVSCEPNKVKDLYPEKRQLAKVIGLSILYGIGGKKLSNFIMQQANIEMSEGEARNIIKEYFIAYPGLLALRERVERTVLAQGYVRDHYGRKVAIDKDKIFSTGVNSLIQSSASDACLFSQLALANDSRAQLVAIVHDEIIYEVEADYAQDFIHKLTMHMTNQGFSCPLKLDAKVATSWADK